MNIEKLEELPKSLPRDFYFRYLKLPWPDDEAAGHIPHEIDEEVIEVYEMYHPLDDIPTGIIIVREEQVLDLVDVPGGQHIRITFTPNTVVMPPARDIPEGFIQLVTTLLAEVQLRCDQAIKTLEAHDYKLAINALSGLEHPIVYIRAKLRQILRPSLPGPRQKFLNK